MDWGAIATSSSVLVLIIIYFADTIRYRKSRERSEGIWLGSINEKMANIENMVAEQKDLCFDSRKDIWNKMDDHSDDISFMQGKMNGKEKK